LDMLLTSLRAVRVRVEVALVVVVFLDCKALVGMASSSAFMAAALARVTRALAAMLFSSFSFVAERRVLVRVWRAVSMPQGQDGFYIKR